MPHIDVDPTDVFPGEIPIGELLDGYNDVESQPKLEVAVVPDVDSIQQHFQILLDEDGIKGPDGKPISITTKVKQASNSKQATAVLDTGFSISQVPKYVNVVPNFREKSDELLLPLDLWRTRYTVVSPAQSTAI